MTVLEFCKKYDVPHQCVYDKIHRKPDLYEPYITRNTDSHITNISTDIFDLLLPKDRVIENLKNEINAGSKNVSADNLNHSTDFAKENSILNDQIKKLTAENDSLKDINQKLTDENKLLAKRVGITSNTNSQLIREKNDALNEVNRLKEQIQKITENN